MQNKKNMQSLLDPAIFDSFYTIIYFKIYKFILYKAKYTYYNIAL